MGEIGDSFRVGEVWVSPRGTYYRVEARDGWHVTLRAGLSGPGRLHKRPWGDVIGWVRPPEHNKDTPADGRS